MRYIIPILFSWLVLATFPNAISARFIEAEIVVYDNRFYKFIDANSQVEILATELGWAEGPVWVESINSLLFSDVAADKIYRWSETSGLSVYLHPSGHAPDDSNQLWRGLMAWPLIRTEACF